MGRYTFDIKKRDAERALRVLFEEDGVPVREIHGALLELQDALKVYIESLDNELRKP